MAGIQLVQGTTTYNAAGAPHPSPISLDVGVLCFLSFVGAPVPSVYNWALTRPTGSLSVLSSANSPGPTFIPDIDGGSYSISLTDENLNTYVLDIVTPSVPSSGPGGGGATVATTMASMRLLSVPLTNDVITLRCWATIGDGGGGTFCWDSTSTLPDDGGITIQLTGIATGRLRRIYHGEVSIAWFGVFGNDDPSGNATNNRTRINTMFAVFAGSYGQCFGAPPGIYYFDDQIVFQGLGGCTLRGAGMLSTLFIYHGAATATTKAFLYWKQSFGCTVTGINFSGKSSTGGRIGRGAQITSGGPTITQNQPANNVLTRCWFQLFADVGAMVGSDGSLTLGDTNTDDNCISHCQITDNVVGGIRVRNVNTNSTALLHNQISTNGTFGIELDDYPRATLIVGGQLSGHTLGEVVVRRNFGAGLTIADTVVEQYGAAILYGEGGSGGVSNVGTIRLVNVTSSYTIGPADPIYPIIDYRGAGTLGLHHCKFNGPGSQQPGVLAYVSVNPSPANAEPGSRVFEYDALDLNDNATISVRTTGGGAMRVVGRGYTSSTSLSDTAPTDPEISLVGGGRVLAGIAVEPTLVAGSFVRNGVVSEQVVYQEITYTMFQAGAGAGIATYDLLAVTMDRYFRIKSVYATISANTDRFRGGAITAATIQAGCTGGGIDRDGLLLPFDAFTATINVGLLDTDLGPQLTRAQAIQGAALPSTFFAGGVPELFCNLTTTGGNISALTQGKVKLTWVLEVMQ